MNTKQEIKIMDIVTKRLNFYENVVSNPEKHAWGGGCNICSQIKNVFETGDSPCPTCPLNHCGDYGFTHKNGAVSSCSIGDFHNYKRHTKKRLQELIKLLHKNGYDYK